jgi:hypothetical protein
LTINQSNHLSSTYIYNDNGNDNCNCTLFERCSSVITDKQLKHDEYKKKKRSAFVN